MKRNMLRHKVAGGLFATVLSGLFGLSSASASVQGLYAVDAVTTPQVMLDISLYSKMQLCFEGELLEVTPYASPVVDRAGRGEFVGEAMLDQPGDYRIRVLLSKVDDRLLKLAADGANGDKLVVCGMPAEAVGRIISDKKKKILLLLETDIQF